MTGKEDLPSYHVNLDRLGGGGTGIETAIGVYVNNIYSAAS
jgi:hypothetical protein